jgi:hypothetical protein
MSNKGHKRIKISPLDKLKALQRSNQYLEDYTTYWAEMEKEGKTEGVIFHPLDRQLSKAGKILCNKYGLFFPVAPYQTTDEIGLRCVQPPITWLEPPSQWRNYKGYCSTKDLNDGETVYYTSRSWDHITLTCPPKIDPNLGLVLCHNFGSGIRRTR